MKIIGLVLICVTCIGLNSTAIWLTNAALFAALLPCCCLVTLWSPCTRNWTYLHKSHIFSACLTCLYLFEADKARKETCKFTDESLDMAQCSQPSVACTCSRVSKVQTEHRLSVGLLINTFSDGYSA